MKPILWSLLAPILALTANASVRFVAPLDGAQVFGLTVIEVTTDTAAVDRVEFRVDGVLAGVARQRPYRIAYDFGPDASASRLIAARIFSDGYRRREEATVLTAAATAGESITVDLVEVPLKIRSSRPPSVTDFQLRENSVRQSIRAIKPGRGPAHFAFIVDRSLSMDGGRLEAALRAVDGAQNLLRAGDTASLILFNHNVSKALPLRPGSAVDALGDAVPSGGTSLRDAVASIGSRHPTYAVVITDGGDRNSSLTEEQALRRISTMKTTVAAIVLGDTASFLQKAVENTGGSFHRVAPTRVAVALRGVIEDINSRYLLVYQSQGTRSGWRTIAVAPQRRGIEILAARKGYFAE